MIAQKQLFRHEPDKGIYGDCWRTVLACLLDMDPREIPHMHVEMESADTWPVAEWLDRQGLRNVALPISGEVDLETALLVASAPNPGLRFMFVGTSRTGCNHIVIAQDGEIIHDPSQTGAGIIGPCADGYWWMEFIGRAV